MVDYYAELSIDSNLGVDEINKELSRLENTWKRRELNNPEKATKMLALIIDAREVFKSINDKSRYDRELAESKQPANPADPNQQQKAEKMRAFSEWRDKAVSFHNDKQYDLAQAALESAFSYMPINYEDSFFYNQAALIYVDNNNASAAMDYVNKAIVIDSSNPDFYLTKGFVFNSFLCGQFFSNPDDRQKYITKSEEMFLKAYNMAAQQNVRLTQADAAGALAVYYLNIYNDESKAELFAQEAVSYGETMGNGSKVLQEISDRRKAREERKQEELRQQEKARREQEEENRRAEESRRKYEEQKREEERRKRERDDAITKRKKFYIIGWLVNIICMIIFFYLFYSSGMRRGNPYNFIPIPLLLILSIAGTAVPAYAEAAYLGYRGTLGYFCVIGIGLYCFFTLLFIGGFWFKLLIVLIVLQIISWTVGKRQVVL